MGSNIYEEREELRAAEWKRKMAAMKRRQIRARRLQWVFLGVAILAIIGIIILIVMGIRSFSARSSKKASDISVSESPTLSEYINLTAATDESNDNWDSITDEDNDNGTDSASGSDSTDIDPSSSVANATYSYSESPEMKILGGDNMTSANAILVDIDSNMIIGGKGYNSRIIPASMTKVLTVLVAAEHIDSIKDTVVMSTDATDFAYTHDCSSVGFAKEEVVTVEDLFYGTILSSGGDAAAQLAIYVAGSQEAFVDMMNQKLEELGISDSAHFTNCVGLYDENHYCSCYDMAVIMNAAIDNEFCRKVMSAHKYTTSRTEQHPEGITISNWFLRRIEDKDTAGDVVCAKTGYVVQSGNCAVSYSEQSSGKRYISVTCDAHSAWRCIYDHVDIYANGT